MKKLWLFLILQLMVAPAFSSTLSDLRTNARVLARDAGTTRQRFTDSQVNTFINEGHRDAVATGKLLEGSTSFALVSGTTYYSLPISFFQVKRVQYKNQILDEKSPEALDNESEGWEEVGGEPQSYFIHFATRTKIGFQPFPNAAASTGTAKVDFYQQAGTLSSDSDTPFDAVAEFTPYHYGLSLYAAYRMLVIDGNYQLAQFYFQEWQSYLAALGVDLRMRPNYKPSVSATRTDQP